MVALAHQNKIILANQAFQDAVKALRANHRDEWEQLYGDFRVMHGLPREVSTPGAESTLVLLDRIERAQEKIKKWQTTLGQRGVVETAV